MHGGAVRRVRLYLIAHLSHGLVFRGGQLHLPGFEDGVRERLLAKHMLAQLHRRQRDRSVHEIRGRYQYTLDVLRLIEQFPPVGVCLADRYFSAA